MSPEQARGQDVDRRGDIWAFGCVLLELLAGKRAFAGATFSDTVAALLDREPDWPALPRETPPAVVRLLRRSLQKDKGKRLHDVADARLELDDVLAGTAGVSGEGSQAVPVETRPRTTWRARLGSCLVWLTVGVAATGTGLWVLGSLKPSAERHRASGHPALSAGDRRRPNRVRRGSLSRWQATGLRRQTGGAGPCDADLPALAGPPGGEAHPGD